jgi:tripartite-type tricarboxylate transporter receptor subunit TctC
MRMGAAVLLAYVLSAQAFPIADKPVRIIVPAPPGGETDIQARAIAQRMGGNVIVENKPGASTVIGARLVQKAAPDGHTLLYTIAVHVQLPHLFRTPPWDAFRDFTPVTTGARSATVLTAHAALPFGTVAELVAYAKAHPGKLNFASFGAGTTSHLNGELLKRLAGIDIVHVPYKGAADAIKDLLAGNVQIYFDGPTTAIANAKSGRVKLIATAAETRNSALPELPTMREAGYDIGMWGYLWFWGPSGMSTTTLEAVYRELARAIEHPEIKRLFAARGTEAIALPPAQMQRAARDLDQRWGEVIRNLGVKLD